VFIPRRRGRRAADIVVRDDIPPDDRLGETLSGPSDGGDNSGSTLWSARHLFDIAIRFDWGGRPTHRVVLAAFPENQPFRAHPG
jgi:hypothetical protein